MPFLSKTYWVNEPQKAFLWLMKTLHCTQKEAQKILDKQRLTQANQVIGKSQMIYGKVILNHFFPTNLKLQKVLQTPYFVIYNKPHKLLTHPKGAYPHLSLCDALKAEFGLDCNPAHRLDYETGGLVLCCIDKYYEAPLKTLFEKGLIKKTYIARVKGELTTKQTINAPILPPPKNQKSHNLSIRSKISPLGKESITQIFPLHYDKTTHTTLLQISPLTGRTHQIRLHLSHIGFPILGDPLYGSDDEKSKLYLEHTLSDKQRIEFFGSSFLHLCASSLEFEFLKERYSCSLSPTL